MTRGRVLVSESPKYIHNCMSMPLSRRRQAWCSRIAAAIRARPSGVLGQVLRPPWFRHRPFA